MLSPPLGNHSTNALSAANDTPLLRRPASTPRLGTDNVRRTSTQAITETLNSPTLATEKKSEECYNLQLPNPPIPRTNNREAAGEDPGSYFVQLTLPA